ncbi:MAG: hypothetical protein WBO29_17155 [Albidovulum sp.]
MTKALRARFCTWVCLVVAAVSGLSAVPVVAQSPSRIEAAITFLQHGRENQQADLIIGGLSALQLLQPTAKGWHPVRLVGKDDGDPANSTEKWFPEARFLARGDQSLLARIDRLEAAGIPTIPIGSVSLAAHAQSEIMLIGDDGPITIGSMYFGAGAVRFSAISADGGVLCPQVSAPRVARCFVAKGSVTGGDITIVLGHDGDQPRMVWLYAY